MIEVFLPKFLLDRTRLPDNIQFDWNEFEVFEWRPKRWVIDHSDCSPALLEHFGWRKWIIFYWLWWELVFGWGYQR